MKVLTILFCLLATTMQLLSQETVAIVTVNLLNENTNTPRRFVIDLDTDHAPRSIAALLLLASPQESFFRNQNATLIDNPNGQYVPALEDGTLLPGGAELTILSESPIGDPPASATLFRNISSSQLATFTPQGSRIWNSDNPVFELSFNSAVNVQRFMIKTNTNFPYIDTTDNIYTGTFVSNTNPSTVYIPTDALGNSVPGVVNYTIQSSDPNPYNPAPQSFDLIDPRSDSVIATFTPPVPNLPPGIAGTVVWTSNNPGFNLILNSFSNGTAPFYQLFEDVSLVTQLTTGSFYDGSEIDLVIGEHPYLSFGNISSGGVSAPGWALQNEMVETSSNSFQLLRGPWGNLFATEFGTVGPQQRYSVALANTDLFSPNTAGAEILITGVAGNPTFRGRHTFIGTVRANNYFSTQFGTVSGATGGGRPLVDLMISGEPAEIVSIDFESTNTIFDPLEFLGQSDQILTIPEIGFERAEPELRRTGNQLEIFSNPPGGQSRFVEASILANNPPIWSQVGQTLRPFSILNDEGITEIQDEVGFNLQTTIAATPRAFFRISPANVTYPTLPATTFQEQLANAVLRFRGLEDEDEEVAQVLNVFNIVLNSDGSEGILSGIGGDLSGNHSITTDYTVTGPFEGELILESPTLPETIQLELYFDAHSASEVNSGLPFINRFRRFGFRERVIPGVGTFQSLVRLESGTWIVE